MTTQHGSSLATRRGGLTLLLCAVQFLDVADSSIMNALPSIRRDLGFSVQNPQWVLDITVGHDRIPGGTDRLKAGSTPRGHGRTHPHTRPASAPGRDACLNRIGAPDQ